MILFPVQLLKPLGFELDIEADPSGFVHQITVDYANHSSMYVLNFPAYITGIAASREYSSMSDILREIGRDRHIHDPIGTLDEFVQKVVKDCGLKPDSTLTSKIIAYLDQRYEPVVVDDKNHEGPFKIVTVKSKVDRKLSHDVTDESIVARIRKACGQC